VTAGAPGQDAGCPTPYDEGCRVEPGCLHEARRRPRIFRHVAERQPEFSVLGVRDGEPLCEAVTFGYRAWDGWVVTLTGIAGELAAYDIWMVSQFSDPPTRITYHLPAYADQPERWLLTVQATLSHYERDPGRESYLSNLDFATGPDHTVRVEWPLVTARSASPRNAGPRLIIPWTGRVPTSKSLDALKPAFAMLGALHARGGSPTGPRKGKVLSRRQCLEWWLAWKFDREPTQMDLADETGVSDPETAVGRWRGTGLTWPPTQAELNEIDDST
jgi:hypothetical protein